MTDVMLICDCCRWWQWGNTYSCLVVMATSTRSSDWQIYILIILLWFLCWRVSGCFVCGLGCLGYFQKYYILFLEDWLLKSGHMQNISEVIQDIVFCKKKQDVLLGFGILHKHSGACHMSCPLSWENNHLVSVNKTTRDVIIDYLYFLIILNLYLYL